MNKIIVITILCLSCSLWADENKICKLNISGLVSDSYKSVYCPDSKRKGSEVYKHYYEKEKKNQFDKIEWDKLSIQNLIELNSFVSSVKNSGEYLNFPLVSWVGYFQDKENRQFDRYLLSTIPCQQGIEMDLTVKYLSDILTNNPIKFFEILKVSNSDFSKLKGKKVLTCQKEIQNLKVPDPLSYVAINNFTILYPTYKSIPPKMGAYIEKLKQKKDISSVEKQLLDWYSTL